MPDTSIVKCCDRCSRIMWSHGTCNHGQVPEPSKKTAQPVVRNDGPVPVIPKKKK